MRSPETVTLFEVPPSVNVPVTCAPVLLTVAPEPGDPVSDRLPADDDAKTLRRVVYVVKNASHLVPAMSRTPIADTDMPCGKVSHSTNAASKPLLSRPFEVVPLKTTVVVPRVWPPHDTVPLMEDRVPIELAPAVPPAAGESIALNEPPVCTSKPLSGPLKSRSW